MSAHAALVGATASGKSALALALARRDPAWELVSVDSMQVYRGMDIGTAKPTPAERAEVPHHLLDLLDPWEDGTVAWFQREAQAVIADIEARGRRALLVGGTALYVQAVVDELDIPGQFPEARAELEADADTAALHRRLAELDPVAAGRMEPTQPPSGGAGPRGHARERAAVLELRPRPRRPPATRRSRLVGLRPLDRGPRGPHRARATRRSWRPASSTRCGACATTRSGMSRTAAQALGYKELLAHLDGELALEEAVDLAVRRTRRFARRQRAWFRRDPRITWLDGRATSRTTPTASWTLWPRLVG